MFNWAPSSRTRWGGGCDKGLYFTFDNYYPEPPCIAPHPSNNQLIATQQKIEAQRLVFTVKSISCIVHTKVQKKRQMPPTTSNTAVHLCHLVLARQINHLFTTVGFMICFEGQVDHFRCITQTTFQVLTLHFGAGCWRSPM